MLTWREHIDGLQAEQLAGGFFEGWPNPPDPGRHLDVLRGSDHVLLVLDGEQVVGFVTAISDGVLCAFVPLLEVLPAWRGRGLGRELVRRLLRQVGELYAVDLVCDPDLEAFYAPMGFQRCTAMVRRRYEALTEARTMPVGPAAG